MRLWLGIGLKTPVKRNLNTLNVAAANRHNKSGSFGIKPIFYLLALIAIGDSFWSLLGTIIGNAFDLSLPAQIVKAFMLSLGLIIFIIRWENAHRIISNLWVFIFPLLLAYASAVWSISPYDTIRGAIMFLLLIFFALALALELPYKAFVIVCVISALLNLAFDFAHNYLIKENQEAININSANIAFLMAASICAIVSLRAARIVWFVTAIFAIAMAILYRSIPIFGVSLGLIGAFLFGLINRARLKAMQKYSLLLSIVILISTLTLILFGSYFSIGLSDLFDHLGLRAVYGNGFQTSGNSIGLQFGMGLGAVGICAALVALLGSIATAYFNGRMSLSNSMLIFGLGANLITAPQNIELIGPISVVFIAAVYKAIIARIKLNERIKRSIAANRNRRP